MNNSIGVRFLFLTVILISIQGRVHGHKNLNFYQKFPPLYNFDDYDSCLTPKNSKLSSTYCMIYAEIKPDNSSQIWQQIVKHSEDYKFHYRRDRLFFGVCLERCKHFINSTQNSLTRDDILIKNEITDYFDHVHKRPLDQQVRKDYHNVIHNCLNYDFQKKFGLNLRTYIEYCERPKEIDNNTYEKDPLESIILKILGIILILNIFSTLYDYYLRRQQPEENQTNNLHKINAQQTASRLLISFSIRRNYYHLIQPRLSEFSKDLSFLDGYRSVCMLFVLLAHTIFTQFLHIANPEYFEKFAENKMVFLNTFMGLEIFFVMSGMLLHIKIKEGRYVNPKTGFKKCLMNYIQLIVLRYIRFIPSVGLLTLTNATFLTHLQDGPFWRHITESLRVFSREKWWRNIFFLNNFAGKKSATHQLWYVAADFQLYALYLLVLFIIAKHPKYKKYILSLLAILAFVIPFSISYVFKLDPGFIMHPECYRFTFLKDIDVFYKVYQPFYTNLAGYLIGIICGELYMNYTRTEQIRKHVRGALKYEIFGWTAFPAALVIFWVGSVLVVREPSIWSAIYAGVHRLVWVTYICAVPLLCMTCKIGRMAYEFCCLPIFQFMAKLSFQVYLWHMTVFYLINGYQRQPVYINTLYMYSQFILLLVLSHLLAFCIALFVEYPIAQIVQVLQSTGNSKYNKKS